MATYYVRPTNGSDANDGLSFGAAWKTTQKAHDTAIAGDTVICCAEAVEQPTETIDVDTNLGSVTAEIYFVGANASGVEDGTVYTISGASLPDTTDLIRFAVATVIRFRNMRFTAAKRHGFAFDTNNSTITTEDCRIDNCTSDGARITAGSPFVTLTAIRCEIDHNGAVGINYGSVNRGVWRLNGCRIHHNGSSGIGSRWTFEITGCVIYRNAAYGLYCSDASSGGVLASNTFFGNGSGSIYIGAIAGSRIHANCFVELAAAYCINVVTQANTAHLPLITDNHYHGHATAATNITGGTPGLGNVTGDPLFASTTDGAEDFTPQAGSPLIGAGFNGSTIGAVSAKESRSGFKHAS